MPILDLSYTQYNYTGNYNSVCYTGLNKFVSYSKLYSSVESPLCSHGYTIRVPYVDIISLASELIIFNYDDIENKKVDYEKSLFLNLSDSIPSIYSIKNYTLNITTDQKSNSVDQDWKNLQYINLVNILQNSTYVYNNPPISPTYDPSLLKNLTSVATSMTSFFCIKYKFYIISLMLWIISKMFF